MNISNIFTVLPKHTNWQPYINDEGQKSNVIFGGVAMSQLDLTAVALANKLLRENKSPCDTAATWKCDFTFNRPIGTGDTIEIVANLISTNGNGPFYYDIKESNLIGRTIEVEVSAKVVASYKNFAVAKFCFVTKKGLEYFDHEIKNTLA